MLLRSGNDGSVFAVPMLPRVWPAVSTMHANTVVVPVAWEQVEPQEGSFDFSFVDTLVMQARERDLRLVLLWRRTNRPSSR